MDVDRSLEDIGKDFSKKAGPGGAKTGRGSGGGGRGGRGGRATRGGRGGSGSGRASRGRGTAGKASGGTTKIFGLAVQRSATATTQRGQGGRRTRGLGRGRGRGVTIERSDAPRRDVSVGYAREERSSVPSGAWSHDKFEGAVVQRGARTADLRSKLPSAKKTPLTTGSKVQVKNLATDVTMEDMKELFETIGPLKKGPTLDGRVCTAVFAKKAHGDKFVEEYNGVELDGKPLVISVVKPKVPATGRLGSRNTTTNTTFTVTL